MSNNGYFLVHRKLLYDWKWQMPYRGAWLWMIAKARWAEHEGLQRGQLRFSVSWAPVQWGMSVTAARNFLKRCENEKDKDGKLDPCILWQRGKGGHIQLSKCDVPGYVLGYGNGDVQCDVVGLITVLKYDEYQPSMNNECDVQCDVPGYVPNVADGYLLKEDINKEQKEKNKHTRKKRASHDREVLQGLLSEINMAEFERTYGPQGLDTFACFDNFTDYVLNGSSKDPRPNPSGYVAPLSRAFHDKCKRDLSKGYFLKKSEPKQEPSYLEIVEQRRKEREAHTSNTTG